MTEPESSLSTPETESAVSTTDTPPAPVPEPMTPERVLEWNAYYDLFVAAAVLLLVFVVSANKISNSALWAQLRAGQVMTEQGAPLVTDPFSYTEAGRRWVNVPWLFEWGHYLLYKLAYGMAPVDPADPAASTARAEQIGTGTLVAVSALVRVCTVLILLRIRRAGSGLWWASVCGALALGAVLTPLGLLLGGIAGPGQVAPGTWGLLLLALELLLWHRAAALGRPRALYGLIPLFLVWANLDESFLIGLLVLAASVVGLWGRKGPKAEGPRLATGLAILGGCVAVCLVNPGGHRIFAVAAAPFLTAFQTETETLTLDQLSFFGRTLRDKPEMVHDWSMLVAYYLVTVTAGLGSFALNRKRFALSRFLVFALAAVLWGYLIRLGAEFAVILAATVVLNGQEWYHDRFGTQGRLDHGWTIWSVGGRLVTLSTVVACLMFGVTGYLNSFGDLQFGFGFNPDLFDFEAADSLKNEPIKGNVLNTTRRQGDALIWRAAPQRKTFVDDRQGLFPSELFTTLQAVRVALKTDDVDVWKPVLDRYDITVVMLNATSAPNTYQQLMQSLNWVPFHDDGNVVLFGRADAPAEDLAYFKAHRLDADALAYKRATPAPAPEGPPMQVSWFDEIYQARRTTQPQPHTEAANHWLVGLNFGADAASFPDPARCFLAIREARTALAHRPNDPLAYRILSECYRFLAMQESALMAGIALTPENAARIVQLPPQPLLLKNRFRQRVTSLNYALMTTPTPKNQFARQSFQALNLELFQLLLSANFLDLARERLKAVLDQCDPNDFKPEYLAQLRQQLSQLEKGLEETKAILQKETDERQPGPLQLAAIALRLGAPGIAIEQLEEADRTLVSPAAVKPQLIDLYNDTGQPDKAAELLSTGNIDDPALGLEPGMGAERQALVYMLLGNYDSAVVLWQQRSIPSVRFDRSLRAIAQAQALINGDPRNAIATLETIPGKLATQAFWEYEIGLCLLEEGMPAAAAEHLAKALTLIPDLNVRRIVAYYLEKLGKPVPPSTADKDKDKDKETDKPKK